MPDEPRDPRTDPRPGDVLEIIPHTFRVIHVGPEVCWIEDLHGDEYPIFRARWHGFARDARVIARGAGGGER